MMVGDCPSDFLELAVTCCNVRKLPCSFCSFSVSLSPLSTMLTLILSVLSDVFKAPSVLFPNRRGAGEETGGQEAEGRGQT